LKLVAKLDVGEVVALGPSIDLPRFVCVTGFDARASESGLAALPINLNQVDLVYALRPSPMAASGEILKLVAKLASDELHELFRVSADGPSLHPRKVVAGLKHQRSAPDLACSHKVADGAIR
jgi:hypothetical protein